MTNHSTTVSTLDSDKSESFYFEPLTEAVKKRITGISFPEKACKITYDELVYVKVLYFDFHSKIQEGELICNKAIGQELLEIFCELYRAQYQIEKIRLIDEYQADDTASITDNNTSCFNYRMIDDTTTLSMHAYGLAIDINPYYNPYVKLDENGALYVSPKGAEAYVNRNSFFPYKIDEDDLAYKLFISRGYIWGGHWNSCKDYQHFQKSLA